MIEKRNIFLPLPLLAAVLLAAPVAAQDPGFGSAVEHNIRAQTVNPNPEYRQELREGGVGLRSVTATRRYLLDRIRPLPGSDMDSAVGRQGGVTTAGEAPVAGQGN